MGNNKKAIIILISLTCLILCIGTSVGSSNTSIKDIISIIGYKIFSIPLAKGINNNDGYLIFKCKLK